MYDTNPPTLDIDTFMAERFGHKLRPEQVLERRIVWNLLNQLAEAGFKAVEVRDGLGDELSEPNPTNPKEAMEHVFNLDDCRVWLRKPGYGEHYVFLVMGNGEDILSDWSFYEDDRDGFNKAVSEFSEEIERWF
jgi:hypothetical protein